MMNHLASDQYNQCTLFFNLLTQICNVCIGNEHKEGSMNRIVLN